MTTNKITDKNILKSWFKRGLKPLEVQFHAWMDSYWHKSESIPASFIENLEATLNSKAESIFVEEMTKGLEEHINDTSKHKTAMEQDKLDHLADNPNATYTRKDEFSTVEPVIFYATYTDDADKTRRRYLVSNDQRVKMVEYFEGNKTAPVILRVSPEDDATQYENYVMTTQRLIGTERTFYFVRIGSPLTNASQCLHRIQMRYNHLPTGVVTTLTVVGSDFKFDESEYKKLRYIGGSGTYDMNNFTESGGILAIVQPASENTAGVVGNNVPEGFTMMNGYVLADSAGCTQVITDSVLKKTMIRSKMLGDEWTPWGEIVTEANDTIIFNATFSTVDEQKKYTIDSAQTSQFADYFDKEKTNPVILKCTASDGMTPQTEIYTLEKIECNSNTCVMIFMGIGPATVTRLRLQGSKVNSGGWLSTINIFVNTYPLSESEYKYNRYITEEPYDMNDMVESGGIVGYVDEYIIGTNVPDGFTDFYGYVLNNAGALRKNSGCCTQVVTDRILQKTMIRSSVPTEDYRSRVWTPWKEIGESSVTSFLIQATQDANTLTVTNPPIIENILTAYKEGKVPKTTLCIAETQFYEMESIILGNDTTCLLTFTTSTIYNNTHIILLAIKSGNTWTTTTTKQDFDLSKFMNVKDIYIVTEYPADLTNYPEGSIFIKQQAS